jgi:hypothetical protein
MTTNAYYFIMEMESDIRQAKKLFKNKGKIRLTKIKHSTWHYQAEFECWGGHKVYSLKTDLTLDRVKEILSTGADLHYIIRSINTLDMFDK